MKNELSIDILLYVALSEEFNDISDILFNKFGDTYSSEELSEVVITVYHGEIYSPVTGQKFRVTVAPAGKMGINKASSITSILINKFRPKNVVVLGIAGSVSNDLQPGDVFIPSVVNEYMANSATKDKGHNWAFQTSGHDLLTDQRLLDRFQNFQNTKKSFFEEWSEDSHGRFSPLFNADFLSKLKKNDLEIRQSCRFIVGDDKKLASGPAVGKGNEFVSWLKGDVDRKIVALEMESSGVYEACKSTEPSPRVIAIRGISDFADDRKEIIEEVSSGLLRSISLKNAMSLFLKSTEAGLFSEKSDSYKIVKPIKSENMSRVDSIFVIGGVTGESSDPDSEEDRLKVACYELGKAIAKAQVKLVICSPYPKSADYFTAMGYSKVDINRVIHFHSPCHVDVVSKRKILEEILGNKTHSIKMQFKDWLYPGPEDESGWPQAWLLSQLQALEKADVIVAIGGKVSKTANTLLHLAEVKGIPIIPFSFLGGAAERSFQRRDWSNLNPDLNTEILENEDGVKDVINIANRLTIDANSVSSSASSPKSFFISRSIKDDDKSIELYKWLESQKLIPFLGDHEIQTDKMAIASINQAMLKSDVCIILWSKDYALSPWCYDELKLAFDIKKTIWLYTLDDTIVVPHQARKLRPIVARTSSEMILVTKELIKKSSSFD